MCTKEMTVKVQEITKAILMKASEMSAEISITNHNNTILRPPTLNTTFFSYRNLKNQRIKCQSYAKSTTINEFGQKYANISTLLILLRILLETVVSELTDLLIGRFITSASTSVYRMAVTMSSQVTKLMTIT